jgi:UDP-glucose 4-epimerase
MNILIIGGTGFLGLNLAKKLIKNNNVVIYSPTADNINLDLNIQKVNASITDIDILCSCVEKANVILHFVSTTTPFSSFNNYEYDLSTNVLPLIKLLDVLKSYKDKKFIYCSSGGAVYGSSMNLHFSETDVKRPITSYGLVKSIMEEYIEFYARKYGLNYLILRPSNVYGLKTSAIGKQGIISTLIYNSILNQQTTIWSSPNNIRDYIYIDDFVDATSKLLTSASNGIYNVGSGIGFSLSNLIELVEIELNTKLSILYTETLISDESVNILDISKISHETGWLPNVDLIKGIGLLHNQMKNQLLF